MHGGLEPEIKLEADRRCIPRLVTPLPNYQTTMKITQDREPINRQAAKQLSRGNGRVQTVEEALRIVAAYVSRPELASEIRQAVDCKAAYQIKIVWSPTWKSDHGISVSITQCLKSSTPGEHNKMFFGELV